MKYLKITNRGTVHRKLLELIGFTTKRELFDNLSIIGSKGSGTKLSTPAALRLGLTIWYCSSDDEGPYVLGYKTQEVSIGDGKKVKQIFFSYGDDNFIPTQLVLESFADWDKPIGADTIPEFKIVRELVANAQDADPSFTIDVVEAKSDGYTGAARGETCVYVSMTAGIRHMLEKHPEQYFKFLSKEKPLYEVPERGAVYAKSSSETRVFLQGILVDCTNEFFTESVFDYSVSDKTLLSEERTVKNSYALSKRIAELLVAIPSVAFWKNIISAIVENKAEYEASVLRLTPKEIPGAGADAIRRAWKEIFGEKGIIASNNRLLDEDARLQGYDVFTLKKDSLKNLLFAVGIKQSSDVVTRNPEIEEIDFDELSSEEQEAVRVADAFFLSFSLYRDDHKKFPVHFFKSADPRANWHGFAGIGETHCKEKWISRLALSKGPVQVLLTYVHESRHCVSKAQDYTAEFEQRADDELVKLMFEKAPRELAAALMQVQKKYKQNK